ncbi:hypothetical protein B0T17DRAFT_592303 [Bombardia bombarda]|uniref:RNB domain-containing protein n=1 Tax=Bombardia bombarda TaxID=252184 RepID=A0AA39WNE9_9PEZI|nr:hypothetical protein B0T17DRAFT_592303 [Bombardia bombarda]
MLRSSTTTTTSQAYICWRCIGRTRPAQSSTAAIGHIRHSPPFRRHASSSLQDPSSSPSTSPEITFKPHESIRSRLRAWEANNPAPALVLAKTLATGPVANAFHSNPVDGHLEPKADLQDESQRLDYDGEDLIDVGLAKSGLQAGDMVEVSSDAWNIQPFAICLGHFNGHVHFYTNTGKWFTRRDVRTRFVVKAFIKDLAELQPVIDALPSTSSARDVLDVLQELKAGPSRDVGAHLIRRMQAFELSAQKIQQLYANKLNNASNILTTKYERIMSLGEIADELLPPNIKRQGKIHHNSFALYAVHNVLIRDNIAFRALDQSSQQTQSNLFRISSRDDVEVIRAMETHVRNFYDDLGKSKSKTPVLFPNPVATYITEVRKMIDKHRASRALPPTGMLGQVQEPASPPEWKSFDDWRKFSSECSRFMHLWAAEDSFPPASHLHWIGSAILRATGRYTEIELLDQATGWIFLQEIGWITPWDLHSRHNLRLPGTELMRAGGISPAKHDVSPEELLGPDRLAHLRRDFKGSTVYCIDDTSADDIDDGVSIEKADKQGEYWIHIHVADPASRIAHDSPLAKQAAVMAQSSYLSGNTTAMFAEEVVRETFSLAPDRPSLAFSARVNEAGKHVDYKVTPAIIRDVINITPEHVSSISGPTDPAVPLPGDTFEVGNPPTLSEPPTRKMTEPKELSKQQLAEIRTLGRLAKAIHNIRIRQGAMPVYLPRAKAEVSLEHTSIKADRATLNCTGNPYIRISYQGNGNPLVSSLMQLAGQVAARWCHDRHISIPYRVQNPAKENVAALNAFTRNVFYPQLVEGKRPPTEDYHTLRQLLGGHDIAAVPSRNYIMGIDMYTKATSPLRRYCDLLVHWQIEAVLLEEHRRGLTILPKSAIPAIVPFSQQDLQRDIIPHLRLRERFAKMRDNMDGDREWQLQALVRAWRFGEGSKPLPKSFQFTVSEVIPKEFVRGYLDWFEMSAVIMPQDLGGQLQTADVHVGDKFAVELTDVNVYWRKVQVKVLETVELKGASL